MEDGGSPLNCPTRAGRLVVNWFVCGWSCDCCGGSSWNGGARPFGVGLNKDDPARRISTEVAEEGRSYSVNRA